MSRARLDEMWRKGALLVFLVAGLMALNAGASRQPSTVFSHPRSSSLVLPRTTNIALASTKPQSGKSFFDHFTYHQKNGESVDPWLWKVERVGAAPKIVQTGGRIRMATGAEANALIAIRGLRTLAPLRFDYLRFQAKFRVSARSGDFDWSVGLEFGPFAPQGPADGTILIQKGTNPNTIKFASHEGVDIDVIDDITVTPTANHVYVVEVDKTGKNFARLYVDGVLRATLRLSVPANPMAPYLQIRTNASMNRWLEADYVSFAGK